MSLWWYFSGNGFKAPSTENVTINGFREKYTLQNYAICIKSSEIECTFSFSIDKFSYILHASRAMERTKIVLNFQYKENYDQLAFMNGTGALFSMTTMNDYLIMHEWTPPPLLERQRMPFARCAAEIPTQQSTSETRSLKITFF